MTYACDLYSYHILLFSVNLYWTILSVTIPSQLYSTHIRIRGIQYVYRLVVMKLGIILSLV